MSLEAISKKFTEETLNTIIRNHGGVKHVSWKFGDGFRKGDNFLSEAHRLIVTGIKEDKTEFELHMIVKSMPKCISRRKTFRSADFFKNEGRFYEVVLKKYVDFQKARNITNGFTEIASCYATLIDGENDFISLEDLSFDGFKTADRSNGLDFYHCKQIMAVLGKFHAVSLAIRDQEPDEFNKILNAIEETYYQEKFRLWYLPYQTDFIKVTRDAISKEFGGTVYESKMTDFTGSNYYQNMCKMASDRGQFSVICQGDCWAPNFLIKYDPDNTVVEDTKMIDFQLARFASPATDISFFLYICADPDVRENNFDELVQIYHRSATSLLTALGSNADEIFPYSALQEELKMYARFGVGMAMEGLPICVMEDAEAPKIDEMEGDEEVPLNKVLVIYPCKTKKGRLRIASTFKHAIDNGYLD